MTLLVVREGALKSPLPGSVRRKCSGCGHKVVVSAAGEEWGDAELMCDVCKPTPASSFPPNWRP